MEVMGMGPAVINVKLVMRAVKRMMYACILKDYEEGKTSQWLFVVEML
jgi:hypothetical protein